MSCEKNRNERQRTRDEVISTLLKYGIFHGNGIRALEESEGIRKFIWFLCNGRVESYESPDAYVKVDNQILIIEHFAIDGFDTFPSGGSKYQRSQAEATRRFDAIPAKETGVHLSTQIGVANSYEGLIKNCQDAFSHHYERISCYKEHLKADRIANEETVFTVCFLMEEVSPFGTLTYDGKSEHPVPVCLARSKEFLDFYANKPEVDWVLFALVHIGDYGFDPYFLSKDDIDAWREDTLDYASYQFLSSEHTVRTDFKFQIPNKE